MFYIELNGQFIRSYKSAKVAYRNAYKLKETYAAVGNILDMFDGLRFYSFNCKAGRRAFANKAGIRQWVNNNIEEI